MTGVDGRLMLGDDVELHGLKYRLTSLDGDVAVLTASGQSPVAIKLGSLFADSTFIIMDSAPLRRRIAGPSTLFESLPPDVQKRARWLEGHITELLDGIPCDAGPDYVPKPSYNPQLSSARQRDLTKIAELEKLGERFSLSKLERLRRTYKQQGILALIDQRLIRQGPIAGQTDQRVIDAVLKVLETNTHQSSGTMDRLMHQVRKQLDDEHGTGVVSLSSRATFHRLVGRLRQGRHATGSARTRRTLLNNPSHRSVPCIRSGRGN